MRSVMFRDKYRAETKKEKKFMEEQSSTVNRKLLIESPEVEER
jgi:hypothetical protein